MLSNAPHDSTVFPPAIWSIAIPFIASCFF